MTIKVLVIGCVLVVSCVAQTESVTIPAQVIQIPIPTSTLPAFPADTTSVYVTCLIPTIVTPVSFTVQWCKIAGFNQISQNGAVTISAPTATGLQNPVTIVVAPAIVQGTIQPNADGTYTVGDPTLFSMVWGSPTLYTVPRVVLAKADYSLKGNILTLVTPPVTGVPMDVTWINKSTFQ